MKYYNSAYAILVIAVALHTTKTVTMDKETSPSDEQLRLIEIETKENYTMHKIILDTAENKPNTLILKKTSKARSTNNQKQ